jgi:hypothetical protein
MQQRLRQLAAEADVSDRRRIRLAPEPEPTQLPLAL